MKATAILTALLLTSGAVQTQFNSNNRPTHIIKLKSAMDTAAAHGFILANHRAFMLSQNQQKTYLRKKRRSYLSTKHQDDEIEGYDAIFSAAELDPKFFLDSMSLDNSFTAVTGIFPDAQFVDYLRQQDSVEYVEMNQIYKAQVLHPLQEYNQHDNTKYQTYLLKVNEYQEMRKKKRSVQMANAANWGLSRVTQRERSNSNEYAYDDAAGETVHVYVLDTGVNVEHLDFQGRAVIDANFVEHESEKDIGGHGTHVAGKIAGHLYGIAKKVQIHSVKILDRSGDGTTVSLIKGISHVIKSAAPGKSLINLSLSGPESKLIDDIINKATTEHNISIFVSAGNSASDACYFSPSSNPNAFSVGATDPNDDVPTYSNTGECVRMYAPGSEIESAWIGRPDASKILDGTSMANPHVTGIAATLLSRKSYDSVHDLYKDLSESATLNLLSFKWTKESSPSKNALAYVESSP